MKNYSADDLTLLQTVQRLQKFTRHLNIRKKDSCPGSSKSWIKFYSVLVVDPNGRLRVSYKKLNK